MDHDAMISWLPISISQSLSCPLPTIEARKILHGLFSSSLLQLSGWLSDSVLNNEKQEERWPNNYENANNLPNRRSRRRKLTPNWTFFLPLNVTLIYGTLEIVRVKERVTEKLSQNPSRVKLLNQDLQLPSYLLLFYVKKINSSLCTPLVFDFSFFKLFISLNYPLLII